MNKKRIKKVVITLTVICVVTTIINIVYNFLLPMYLFYKMHTDLRDANSIGIIGGADGPTAIFVANSSSSNLFGIIIALPTIVGIAYLILSKRKEDNSGKKN